MKKTVVAVAGVVLLALAATSYGQIRVIKQARGFTENPTLLYRGVSGDAALSGAVGSFLKACGWFRVISGNADYTVSGQTSGGSVKINVKALNEPGFAVRQSTAGGSRETAKLVVDAILKAVFKTKGICRSKIAFSGESGRGIKNIFLCDIDGGGFKRLTSFRSLCVEPSWSPNGKSIVYTKYGRAVTNIIETQLFPLRSRRLVGFKGLNTGGEISPNGKYLALILSKDGQVELYVKALEGRAKRRLTHGPAPEASPCWSPTGGRLCYVSGRSGRPRLYLIGANGGSSTRLNTEGSEASSPSWSSDNKIVYACRMGRNYAIALYDLKNPSENRVLTKLAGSWESPSWAPDNRHVVCSRSYGGRTDLYIIDSWSGKIRKLLGSRSKLTMPTWSPIR
jgi:TolB protein